MTFGQFREHYDCSKQAEFVKLIGISEGGEGAYQDLIKIAKNKNLSQEDVIAIIKNTEEKKSENNALDRQSVVTNDALDSKTKPVINLLGRLLYEEYLKRMIKDGCYSVGSSEDVFDFSLAASEYVDVVTTTDTFKRGVPLHITIEQNEFLKDHPESHYKIVRVSLRDLDLLSEYSVIKNIFKSNLNVEKNAGLRNYCENVVADYWHNHEVNQFEDKIRVYQIKIERK